MCVSPAPDPFVGVVLLAADDPLVRMVVAGILIDMGFHIIEAVNAAETPTVLRAGIEVLWSDVEIPPGPNGYD